MKLTKFITSKICFFQNKHVGMCMFIICGLLHLSHSNALPLKRLPFSPYRKVPTKIATIVPLGIYGPMICATDIYFDFYTPVHLTQPAECTPPK